MQPLAIQAGIAAATAITGQLAHAVCPKGSTEDERPEDGSEQQSSGGRNNLFDADSNDELTLVRFVGQRPPGIEQYRVSATWGGGNVSNQRGSVPC